MKTDDFKTRTQPLVDSINGFIKDNLSKVEESLKGRSTQELEQYRNLLKNDKTMKAAAERIKELNKEFGING